MYGYDEHRLGDQPETALLHDGGRHGHGLAGADGMSKVRRAIGDDAQMPRSGGLKEQRIQRPGKFEMGTVEFARGDIVEAVIIIARQPVGAIRIGPDPVLEGLLDPLQLVPGRLRLSTTLSTRARHRHLWRCRRSGGPGCSRHLRVIPRHGGGSFPIRTYSCRVPSCRASTSTIRVPAYGGCGYRPASFLSRRPRHREAGIQGAPRRA